MANVASSLRTYLLEKSPITSLVGQRMYVDNLPQNAVMPAIVYRRISTRPEHSLDDITWTFHSRIEFRCYATTRAGADAVSNAVKRSGLFSFRDKIDNIQFYATELDSGDGYEDELPTDGTQVYRYVTTFDLLVHYSEGV